MTADEDSMNVDQLFMLAADMPITDQDRYIDNADVSEEVKRKVRALLAHAIGPGIKSPVVIPAVQMFTQRITSQDELIGTEVGSYRITGPKLGEGGYGQVYAGCRIDGQFEGRVAIKVLKAELMGTDAVERFAMERLVLGAVKHASIVRMLDAESLATGQPYFVMDYLEGKSITQYARLQRLTIAKRLDLFLTLCEAVACLHRHGYVHRDIKAGNTIVSMSGGCVLIDFGLCKAVHPAAGRHHQPPTAVCSPVRGTPGSQSPEHQNSPEIVDEKSDIYCLGLILYELLYGIDTNSRNANNDTTDLINRRYDFKTRSVKVVAHERRTSVRGLKRQLRGRLARTVKKATAVDRDERFDSADELLREIRRYLSWERSGKWQALLICGVVFLCGVTMLSLAYVTMRPARNAVPQPIITDPGETTIIAEDSTENETAPQVESTDPFSNSGSSTTNEWDAKMVPLKLAIAIRDRRYAEWYEGVFTDGATNILSPADIEQIENQLEGKITAAGATCFVGDIKADAAGNAIEVRLDTILAEPLLWFVVTRSGIHYCDQADGTTSFRLEAASEVEKLILVTYDRTASSKESLLLRIRR